MISIAIIYHHLQLIGSKLLFQDESEWNPLVLNMYREQGHDLKTIIERVRKAKAHAGNVQLKHMMAEKAAAEKAAAEKAAAEKAAAEKAMAESRRAERNKIAMEAKQAEEDAKKAAEAAKKAAEAAKKAEEEEKRSQEAKRKVKATTSDLCMRMF